MGNTSGLAITALVLGILGLVFVWVPFLGQILAIGAIVCGIIGLYKLKEDNKLNGKGMAIAGIVLGGIALLTSVFVFIGMMAYFGVLSPSHLLPERTTFGAPLFSIDNAEISASTNNIQVSFRNNAGVPIAIPLTTEITSAQCVNPILTGKYNGLDITTNTQILSGETFVLQWTCGPGSERPNVGDEFKATISFDYVNSETGMTRKETGSVDGQYK